jgi:muramoyltetrapeptide carboxypeptidase LdcA involved in peptidoglycan recycling
MTRMAHELVHPPKARRGERIAVLSPSFAAAGALPAVHEQAMRRLTEVTGLIPVEYPTTRTVGAAPRARAADINAAFADPAIRAILAVIGGEDQITVIPTWTPSWPGVIPSRSWA